MGLLWNSPVYLESILELTSHFFLPVWSFAASVYMFKLTVRKYYNVLIKKDNMDCQADVTDGLKIFFDRMCKGYLLLIPLFFFIYVYFLFTKAIMGGEWTKMRVITWWIYYFGISNLWPSWLFTAFWMLK